MAMLGDTPGEELADLGAGGFDAGALAQQWRAWMAEPANRAAMLQTGLALMQPMGIGQSPAGHFAQAIGGGGEAASRVVASDRLDAEAERKNFEAMSRGDLRAAQAETGAANAESRRIASEAARLNSESNARLREGQLMNFEAKRREIDARIELNNEKLKNDRENVQLKREAMRLAREKLENDARLREMALGIQRDRATTYDRSVTQRGQAAQEAIDQKLTKERDTRYENYAKEFRFTPEGRKKGAVPMTREEWDKKNPISQMPGRGSSVAPPSGGPPGWNGNKKWNSAGDAVYQLASGDWVDEDGNPVE